MPGSYIDCDSESGQPRSQFEATVKAPPESDKSGANDLEELARNLARMVENGGKALAAYMRPREAGRIESDHAEMIDMVKTLGEVAEYWIADPQRSLELQSRLAKGYLDLWEHSARRLAGQESDPVVVPDPRDKRFSDPEWQS